MPALDPALQVAPSRWSRWSWVLPVAALAAVMGWYATHPNPLPDPGAAETVSTTSGKPVYVGMLSLPGRTLSLRDVTVQADGGAATPLVCREGSIGVTTQIQAFCADVVPADGATLAPGDQLVVEVTGTAGTTVEASAPLVSFREGIQWGQARTGRPVQVTVLG